MKKSASGSPALLKRAGFIAGTAALSMAFCAPTFAQSDQEVLLTSPDGNVSLNGTLVSVDDEFYTVQGQLGTIRVPRDAVDCFGAACPSAVAEPSQVVATREVALNSIDDATRIAGELIDFDDTHYVIRNALGEFRIMISGVTCEGAACPIIDVFDIEYTFHVPSGQVSDLLVAQLRDYAAETNQTFATTRGDETTQSVQFFSGDELEMAADITLIVSDPQAAASALSDKTADIIVYDQQQIDPQLASTADLGPILQTAFAFDGDVIVSNENNPVRDLSLSEINQITNRNLPSWRTLGGGDFPISIHMVEDGFSATPWLNGVQTSSIPSVVTHSTQAQVIEAVNGDRNAIGIVKQTSANVENANVLAVRDVCGLTTEPTRFNLRTQRYPFTQSFNSYARGDAADPFVLSFLDWTQTRAAASSVSTRGYTGADLQRTRIQDMGVAVIHAAAVEPDFDGVEFSAMMRELRAADRLSITFTFLTGSTVLDEVSTLNLKDLAQRLRDAEFDGQEVLLVGFADNTGPAGPNSALSLRRAETVRAVLAQEFDPALLEQFNLTSLGYGEQMPVACNNTEDGRADNRRVEVWVRQQG